MYEDLVAKKVDLKDPRYPSETIKKFDKRV